MVGVGEFASALRVARETHDVVEDGEVAGPLQEGTQTSAPLDQTTRFRRKLEHLSSDDDVIFEERTVLLQDALKVSEIRDTLQCFTQTSLHSLCS